MSIDRKYFPITAYPTLQETVGVKTTVPEERSSPPILKKKDDWRKVMWANPITWCVFFVFGLRGILTGLLFIPLLSSWLISSFLYGFQPEVLVSLFAAFAIVGVYLGVWLIYRQLFKIVYMKSISVNKQSTSVEEKKPVLQDFTPKYLTLEDK